MPSNQALTGSAHTVGKCKLFNAPSSNIPAQLGHADRPNTNVGCGLVVDVLGIHVKQVSDESAVLQLQSNKQSATYSVDAEESRGSMFSSR